MIYNLQLRTAQGNTLQRTYSNVDMSTENIKFFNAINDYVSLGFAKGILNTITLAQDSLTSSTTSVDKIGCVSCSVGGYSLVLEVTSYESIAIKLGRDQETALLKAKFNQKQQQQQMQKSKQQKDSRNLAALVKQRTGGNKPDTQKELIKAALFKANHADTLLVKGFDMAAVTILKDTANHLVLDYAGTPVEIDGEEEVLKMKQWLKAQ
jgi:hypothetical protein